MTLWEHPLDKGIYNRHLICRLRTVQFAADLLCRCPPPCPSLRDVILLQSDAVIQLAQLGIFCPSALGVCEMFASQSIMSSHVAGPFIPVVRLQSCICRPAANKCNDCSPHRCRYTTVAGGRRTRSLLVGELVGASQAAFPHNQPIRTDE